MFPGSGLTIPMETTVSPPGDSVCGSRKARRSRNGCWTCRSKKVKCDELDPECRRCSRLGLACIWIGSPLPLKERRRGLGSIKSRERWTPGPIRPHSQTCERDDIQTPSSSSSDVHQDTSDIFRDSESSPQPSNLQPDTRSNAICHELNEAPTPDILDSAPYGILGSVLEDPSDGFVTDSNDSEDLAKHGNSNLSAIGIMQPAHHIALPNAMTLSPVEHFAVDYYQRTFSVQLTTKAPSWSTTAILLQVGAQNSMVMHLLLSSMLSEMTLGQAKSEILLKVAQQHYRAGLHMLVELLTTADEPDHVMVMSAFWFLYVCSRRRKEMNFQTISQLSMGVKNHVEMFGLHRLVTAPPSSSREVTQHYSGRAYSLKEQSLLARLIIWIYYSDVKYSFCGCQGALAGFLQSQSAVTDVIYDRSRSVLQLNWGTEYPPPQAIDDMENSAPLELLYKLLKAVQRVNEASQNSEPMECWGPKVEQQLNNMELEYSTIFGLAATSIAPRNRLLCNIDWIVSHFYALRIYHFRCTSPPEAMAPRIVQGALKSLLVIAQRTINHGVTDQRDRMQWPLFLAGIETRDPIYREWILDKMPPSELRATLEAIFQAQETSGVRVSAKAMRDMYLSKSLRCNGLGS